MTGDTYLAAGVDREAAKRTKDAIVSLASGTLGPQVIGGIGFFGGMYQLAGYNQPVLVSSTDSVGTKVKIASIMEASLTLVPTESVLDTKTGWL